MSVLEAQFETAAVNANNSPTRPNNKSMLTRKMVAINSVFFVLSIAVVYTKTFLAATRKRLSMLL